MMRHKGKEKVTDLPLPSPAIEVLAVEAISRDLNIAELIGQVLVAALNKDMIQRILRRSSAAVATSRGGKANSASHG